MSKRGRPPGSKYSAAIAEEILARLADGETLRKICQSRDMPDPAQVVRWANGENTSPVNDFPQRYARARQSGYDAMAEQIVEISDIATGEDAQARRLQVDARKWLLSKMMPKRYGDKLELSGDPAAPLVVTDLRKLSDAELATLEALAAKAGVE